MSFRYARAGTYKCDHDGCPERVLSPSGDLPDGWTYRVVEWEEPQIGGHLAPVSMLHHYCPMHAEAK